MIISELKIYNFRQFKSVNGVPGLEITFHKGLNALIGENDSGKSAVIDALKLILLTQSNEYIRPSDEDFYKPVEGEACSELMVVKQKGCRKNHKSSRIVQKGADIRLDLVL